MCRVAHSMFYIIDCSIPMLSSISDVINGESLGRESMSS